MDSSTLGNELINIFGNASIGTAVKDKKKDKDTSHPPSWIFKKMHDFTSGLYSGYRPVKSPNLTAWPFIFNNCES